MTGKRKGCRCLANEDTGNLYKASNFLMVLFMPIITCCNDFAIVVANVRVDAFADDMACSVGFNTPSARIAMPVT